MYILIQRVTGKKEGQMADDTQVTMLNNRWIRRGYFERFKYYERRKEKGNKEYKQKTNNKIVHLSANISMVTLNVNGLNTPTKDRCCQNILKKWIQLHSVYKKFSLI